MKEVCGRIFIRFSALAVASACLLCCLVAPASGAESYVTVQLTSNTTHDENPQVSGDRIVWSGSDGSDQEIYTWTPAEGVVQLTANNTYDGGPQVSGDRIVWSGSDGGDTEIFTWTPAGGVVQVTDNSGKDASPQVSGDRIVWAAETTAWHIFTWTPSGGIVQVTNVGAWAHDPQVSGDRIVWESAKHTELSAEDTAEVFTWTPGTGTVQLTDDKTPDHYPHVSGNRVVWERWDGTDWEIYTWTPAGGVVHLTANNTYDREPQVSGDRIVWYGSDESDFEIFTWTPTGGTVQLTDNSISDSGPQVSGDRIVWAGDRVYGVRDSEIFTWTPDSGIVQLTDNTTEDENPQTSGDRIVWMGWDASLASGSEIFTAVPASTTSLSFLDVPVTHPYYTAIIGLATRGIVSGYGHGLFGPEHPVTRQQFAKMIVRTGGYPVSEADVCPFSDVAISGPDGLYPDNYVAVCAAKGITVGKTATAFDPYANITRYQVISMVVRAADDAAPGMLGTAPAGYGTWGMDPTHGAHAARAEYGGLLDGLDLSALDPYSAMTRGEVARILYNLDNRIVSWMQSQDPPS